MKIDLPKAGEWSPAENYAENLRSAIVAGEKVCMPVGSPETILPDAGLVTTALTGGDILAAGDDRHDLMLNGKPCGSLGAPLVGVLPGGEPGEALLFTTSGPEWLASGALQGAAPAAENVTLRLAAGRVTLSAEVIPPQLAGDYPRLSAPLKAADAEAMARAVDEALTSVNAQARIRGMWVQPAWVGWQMVDSAGRVLARGVPELFGSLQGDDALTFRARHENSSFAIDNSATFSADAYSLTLSVGRSESEFWRTKVAAIEIVAWPDLGELTGVTGAFAEISSAESTLNLTPVMRLRERTDTEPRVVARLDSPLLGVNVNLYLKDISECFWPDDGEGGQEETEAIIPSAVYSGGTLTAYGLARKPGVLSLAPGDDPLRIAASRRVSRGRILRICAPAGGGGGWNYGRHHLLVFATDGIYSVSVDSSLRSITSSIVYHEGITRADAVVLTPDCVCAASASGRILRLRGSRVGIIQSPFGAKALGWNAARGELWLITSAGAPMVIDSEGGASLRTDIAVERFIEPAMAVDSAGALRNLGAELPVRMHVGWRRRATERLQIRKRQRRALWRLDTERATDLSLRLLADGGGAPQRLLELTVNGPVNAPVVASVLAPVRSYFTAVIRGYLLPPARLHSVELKA